MVVFYQISIFTYLLLIHIASLFNGKAKKWVQGRKDIFKKIEAELVSGENYYWFHCASLGEYEQGKPLIEKLKHQDPNLKIVVTFFSPSGYEHRKDDPLIDHVFYLPYDSPSNAKRFVDLIKPTKAFFIKYEFWYFYLKELHASEVPTFLVSGVFRESQLFFKSYGSTHKEMLTFFTFFFVQNERSKRLLNSLSIENVVVTGDTRIDRVHENAKKPKKLPLVEQFIADRKVIVVGSSWKEEEKIICDFIMGSDKEFKYIIAPHDVSKARISSVENLLGESNFIKYSEATPDNIGSYTILLIDNIGILANVYQYTDIAFIGGGFRGALHNVLEPASFGNVVLFGKKHSKFHEAEELLAQQAAYEISYTDDLIAAINYLLLDENLKLKQEAAREYILSGVGASDQIIEHL